MVRPAIPIKLKRQILVESGHRCAIPTCRHPTTEIAHIEPWAKEQKHEYGNLIALCPNCHTRFDKGEIDKDSMKIYKQKLIFLSDRYTKYELNVLTYLKSNQKVIVSGELTVINLLDDGLIEKAHVICYFTYTNGTREDQEFVVILTKKGQEFMKEWESVGKSEWMY